MNSNSLANADHFKAYFLRYKGGRNLPLSPYIQSGGFIPFIGYKYYNVQEGQGLGNLLGSVFRTIIPLVRPTIQTVKSIAKPIIKKAAKRVGREFLEGGIKVGIDALEGKNLKDSIKKHAQQSIKTLKKDTVNEIKRKIQGDIFDTKIKKAKIARSKKNKKTKTKDIFG